MLQCRVAYICLMNITVLLGVWHLVPKAGVPPGNIWSVHHATLCIVHFFLVSVVLWSLVCFSTWYKERFLPVPVSASLCSAACRCAQRGLPCQGHGAACPWSPALPWRCHRRPVLSRGPAACSGRSRNEAQSSSRLRVLWSSISQNNNKRRNEWGTCTWGI